MKRYLEFHEEISVQDAFRDTIKHGRYEQYVFLIISRSTVIFKGRTFNQIHRQSKGECDFVDNYGIKYDAKLLLDEKQGALIGERKNEILSWLRDVAKEINEFSLIYCEQDNEFVLRTRLYGIIVKRLNSVEADENVIFFSPYPIVIDSKDSYLISFGSDLLDAIYCKLKEDGIVGNRKIYYIYPTIEEGVYVLRDAEGGREYISVPELTQFISFRTKQDQFVIVDE